MPSSLAIWRPQAPRRVTITCDYATLQLLVNQSAKTFIFGNPIAHLGICRLEKTITRSGTASILNSPSPNLVSVTRGKGSSMWCPFLLGNRNDLKRLFWSQNPKDFECSDERLYGDVGRRRESKLLDGKGVKDTSMILSSATYHFCGYSAFVKQIYLKASCLTSFTVAQEIIAQETIVQETPQKALRQREIVIH